MMNDVWYNEIEPFAVEWLRELMQAGEIGAGVVDERPIQEITADELIRRPGAAGRRRHFFAGIGGWELALKLAGWDDSEYAHREVWTGSCPCQPFSQAGKRKGVDDPRHLWPAWYELIKVGMPAIILGEQVASADGRQWLSGVRADLEALGYGVGAADLCAACVAAPHPRQRLFWVAVAHDRDSRERPDGRPVRRQERHDPDGGGTDNDAAALRLAVAPDGDGRRGERGAEEGAGPDGERRRGLAGGGVDGRVADAGRWNSQCGGFQVDDSPEAMPGEAREQRVRPDLGHGRDPDSARCPGASWCPGASRCPNASRMGDSGAEGLPVSEQEVISGAGRGEEGRAVGESGGSWGDSRWIPCSDGFSRRVGRGVFPLAYGLPRSLGLLRAGFPGLGEVAGIDKDSLERAKRNRIGRLRGYGNAIVPELAAVFVRAVMEAMEEKEGD